MPGCALLVVLDPPLVVPVEVDHVALEPQREPDIVGNRCVGFAELGRDVEWVHRDATREPLEERVLQYRVDPAGGSGASGRRGRCTDPA